MLNTDCARRNARKNFSTSDKTPAAKRTKQDTSATPTDSMDYPTPPDNKNSLKKKPKGKPVPQDLKSADVADRMMFRWKNAGRPWDEIRDEYARLTGTRPASSSLSVRFIKLNENLAANGFRDVSVFPSTPFFAPVNDVLIVAQAIHESFYETFPDRKYMKTYTKPTVQEVALLKAVAEAEIKTSQPFWKEVSVQMKKTTGEDFAPASLRKKMEEVKKKQFYIGEQSLAKDDQWPPLPKSNASKTNLFQKMPNLDSRNKDNKAKANNQNERRHTSTDSLFKEEMRDADDTESISTAVGQARSFHFIYSNGKERDTSGVTHQTFEDENASPTHTHPRGSYGNVGHARDFSSNSPEYMSVNPSTPTPAAAAGVALMGRGLGAGRRPGLVGYGDSDDSD
jgi:hypothetical protein